MLYVKAQTFLQLSFQTRHKNNTLRIRITTSFESNIKLDPTSLLFFFWPSINPSRRETTNRDEENPSREIETEQDTRKRASFRAAEQILTAFNPRGGGRNRPRLFIGLYAKGGSLIGFKGRRRFAPPPTRDRVHDFLRFSSASCRTRILDV